MITIWLLLAQADITAKLEPDGAIRVVAPGAFETTFTKRKGFGSSWYDLKRDPEKKLDLAPVLDENGFFWVKLGKPETDASWYANPAEEMNLLEAGPVRVRVETRGAHARYGKTEAAAQWKECRFHLVHTLYPNGNVYIAYTLEQAQPVPYRNFLIITKSTGAWGKNGKGEVRVAGEGGPDKPRETAFHLQWSDGPTYFTDILMAAYKNKYKTAYWNEGYQDKDVRTSFDVGGLFADRTLPAGKARLQFLMRFADDMNSEKEAATVAVDYRSPDALTVIHGEADKSDEGDRDADGFNEEEGCYVLKSGENGVAFTIRGRQTPRVQPVFKVKGWMEEAPKTVTLDGAAVPCRASVKNGILILQVPIVLREDAKVKILNR